MNENIRIENTNVFSDNFKEIDNNKKAVTDMIKSLNLEQEELKYLLTLSPFNFTGLYKLSKHYLVYIYRVFI